MSSSKNEMNQLFEEITSGQDEELAKEKLIMIMDNQKSSEIFAMLGEIFNSGVN